VPEPEAIRAVRDIAGVKIRRRIGVLGGSFDPPHVGHIEIARRAKEAIGLDKVLLVVAGNPYQKRPRASAEDRYEMTVRAARGLDGIEVPRFELDRPGPSYTIDTVEALRRQDPFAEIWLILGADALNGIKSWHRWEELVDSVKFCVVPREGFPLEDALSALNERRGEFCVLDSVKPLPYSSTSIRRAVASGKRPEGVDPAVASYIEERGLYRFSEDRGG